LLTILDYYTEGEDAIMKGERVFKAAKMVRRGGQEIERGHWTLQQPLLHES
jgi:hypothetical protein